MSENEAVRDTNSNLPYKTCEHIKDDGVRCGGPALRGQPFCRFHVRLTEPGASPGEDGYTLPLLETEQSVQIALQQMMSALLSGKLSERKAAVMLSGIKAAAALIRQAQSNTPKQDLLNEIASELCTRVPVRPAVGDPAKNDWRREA